jgi:hypothetical protein
MTCIYNKRRNTGNKSQTATILYNTHSQIEALREHISSPRQMYVAVTLTGSPSFHESKQALSPADATPPRNQPKSNTTKSRVHQPTRYRYLTEGNVKSLSPASNRKSLSKTVTHRANTANHARTDFSKRVEKAYEKADKLFQLRR